MNSQEKNNCILNGSLDKKGLFPKLEELLYQKIIFNSEFGLDFLPEEPGIILIRGARQLGKSTWLEKELKNTLSKYGSQTAYYLNGDDMLDNKTLYNFILELCSLFPKNSKIKRIFIDEITAIENWEIALKKLADEGIIKNILIITTGSKAVDIRRGTERLPGRKGRLKKTLFRFTPVSFKQFNLKIANDIIKKDDKIIAYCLTGGSPIAINALIEHGRIPEYIYELTKDWIFGETSLQGRSINSLKWILTVLYEHAGMPVSSHVIAEKAGLANNTVVDGYIELLKDLGVLTSAIQIDTNNLRPIPRKASKYHFTNLLFANVFHNKKPQEIEDLKNIFQTEKGKWLEWLVAQELWRRNAINGHDSPEQQFFWKSDKHEIDFIDLDNNKAFIEVKGGKTQPSDFIWFSKVFPNNTLLVVNDNRFHSSFSDGITFEEFLSIF